MDKLKAFGLHSVFLYNLINPVLLNLTPEEKQLKAVVQRLLGEHIRAIRLSKNIKQKTVAERCGFTPSGYNLMENGERNITFFSLLKISKVLDVPLEQLVQIEGIDEIPNPWV